MSRVRKRYGDLDRDGIFLEPNDISRTYSDPGDYLDKHDITEVDLNEDSQKKITTLSTTLGQIFNNKLNWVYFILYLIISFSFYYLIKQNIKEPYMDEIFHIPQAQHYCLGNFRQYDTKLTTPPGLYILSLALTYWFKCDISTLRLFNIILGLVMFWVIAIALKTSNTNLTKNQNLDALVTFTISSFPIGFFYHHLYYTDTISNLFILVSFILSLHSYHWTSSLFSLISLTFRQTNIVWVLFIMVYSFLLELTKLNKNDKVNKQIADLLLMKPFELGINMDNRISAMLLILETINNHFLKICFKLILPYVIVISTFLSFIIWNGGIVLGDKSNHVATLHLTQLFYYATFVTAMSWSYVYFPLNLKTPFISIFNWLYASFKTPLAALRTVLSMGLILLVIHNFTINHPFLLSDNRHISFYIWKNLFRYHPMQPYIYAPLYHYIIWLWTTTQLQRSQKPLILWIGYFISIMLILIPSPLLELRYFIQPFIIFRCFLIPKISDVNYKSVLFELVTYTALNLCIIYLFIYKPFSWPSEPGVSQRFMW